MSDVIEKLRFWSKLSLNLWIGEYTVNA